LIKLATIRQSFSKYKIFFGEISLKKVKESSAILEQFSFLLKFALAEMRTLPDGGHPPLKNCKTAD
jgi:hypothetical protein